MAKAKTDPSGSVKGFFKRLQNVLGRIIKTAVKACLMFWYGVVLILGSCSVYEAYFPEVTPEVHSLHANLFDRDVIYLTSPEPKTEEERWIEVQPSLEILDIVCPEVSEWVRERHDSGKLGLWSDRQSAYAYYDFFTQKVTVTSAFYTQCHGMRAVTLAHEYRHSLQMPISFVRHIFYGMLTHDECDSFMEKPAEQFELEAKLAIFNPYIFRQ